jgi:hypothetical protein
MMMRVITYLRKRFSGNESQKIWKFFRRLRTFVRVLLPIGQFIVVLLQIIMIIKTLGWL